MNMILLLLAVAGVGLVTWGTVSKRAKYRYWLGVAVIVGCAVTYAIRGHQMRRIASVEGSMLKSDMVSSSRARMLPGGGN